MAPQIPTTEPTAFTGGDTVKWTRTLGDYPASAGWVLTYAFRGADAIDVTAAPDGDRFLVTIAAADSNVPAGSYEWIARVSKAGEVHTVARGRVQIAANLATAAPRDRQAFVERALAKVETQIEELLADPVESFTIAQRTVQRRKLEELEKLRKAYRVELRMLRGGGRLPNVEVSFGRA